MSLGLLYKATISLHTMLYATFALLLTASLPLLTVHASLITVPTQLIVAHCLRLGESDHRASGASEEGGRLK